uniref:Uncharacterized protein n=1 Tax=Oryza brachyantha TaxID=4533 RepID=J3MD51_ORYBR
RGADASAERSRSHRVIACGGTKRGVTTALLTRKSQVTKPIGHHTMTFLQVVQLLPQACCLYMSEPQTKMEVQSGSL